MTSLARAANVLVKDLRLGPRSPLVLWALIVPVVITLLIRGVFGGLFAADPRLGIVDLDSSELVPAAQGLDGIEVTLFDDPAALYADVEANDLDAGVILPPGFDDAVRAGEQPELELFVAGESLASTRIVLAVTALDLVRDIEGRSAPVDVEVVAVGDEPIALDLRMLPLIVIMAVALAGVMIPAASLIDEKSQGTLAALLVTPTSIVEVLGAKGVLGATLAVAAGTITLAVNGVLGISPAVMLLAVVLGALMMTQIGLILGSWARDINTLFAAWKSGGLILFFPVIFFIWPDLPTWPARLGPTYYFLSPVYAVSLEGASLRDVWPELAIAAAICVALIPATAAAGRWLEGRLGTRKVTPAPEPEPAT